MGKRKWLLREREREAFPNAPFSSLFPFSLREREREAIYRESPSLHLYQQIQHKHLKVETHLSFIICVEK